MHAYLYIGGDSIKRDNEMLESAKMSGGTLYNFSLRKIEDVRDLANFSKYSQNNPVSIVLKNIDHATTEAQNAFLKNLEEPIKNIKFFLSCNSEQAVLSTVVSRCQIIRIGQKSVKTDSTIYSDYLKKSVGLRFKHFKNLRKKDEAIKYLRDLTLSAHNLMIKKGKNTQTETSLIKIAQKTINNLNSNANVNLQMTNFAVKSTKI